MALVQILYDVHTFKNEKFTQQEVEKPQVYIIGRSPAAASHNLSYSEEISRDLRDLPERYCLRFCSVDLPQREYNAGTSIGGGYKCICGVHTSNFKNFACAFQVRLPTLFETRDLVKAGVIWRERNSHISPLNVNNMDKATIQREINARNLPPLGTKEDLKQRLLRHLHGAQRVPPLLTGPDYHATTSFEISPIEFMHDFAGLYKAVMTELPHHLPSPEKETLQKFFRSSIGDKCDTLKASDCRRNAVKLVVFARSHPLSPDVIQCSETLLEICKIGYSTDHSRSPKQVLRFYNLTFRLGMLLRDMVVTPKSGCFFGSYFHSITVHAAQVYRVICVRSLLVEEDEATFNMAKQNTLLTSDRKSNNVIANLMLRLPVIMEELQDITHQQNEISRSSMLVSTGCNTRFTKQWINKHRAHYQEHLGRIADFLNQSEGVWWRDDGAAFVFLDGDAEPAYAQDGPTLAHFR